MRLARWSHIGRELCGLGLLVACSTGPSERGATSNGGAAGATSPAVDGRAVYETPLTDGNSFACQTCHALSEPSRDGMRRPGHPIGDAPHRTSWKNGQATSFLQAVNSCVTEWMVAPAWREDDARYLALREFLDADTGLSRAPNLSYQIVAPPADFEGGDATRGQALFNRSCAVCHGADGRGTVRGPRVASSARLPEYVASRIRTSGSASSAVYPGLSGGVMPFWAEDRLSDAELVDLVAFVTSPASPDAANGGGGSAGNQPDPGSTGGASEASGGGGTTGCGTTHPRVGSIVDLGINTGEGQVSGFVHVIDDCTLELRDFSYDGNGIDVRVYASETTAFKPGFSLGPNIVNRRFDKETFRVTLPDGKTLDDFQWIGIWCIAVGANFGSGKLRAP
jgi:mono/diheme cytochrome c family protein